MKLLSEVFKEEIARREISLNALAKESGIAQAQLWHIMQGTRDIRLATAEKLAAYLGLQLVRTTGPKAAKQSVTSRKSESKEPGTPAKKRRQGT